MNNCTSNSNAMPEVTLKSIEEAVRSVTRAPEVQIAVNPATNINRLLEGWKFEGRKSVMGLYGIPVIYDEAVPVDALRVREEGKPEFFVK